jgi:nitroimidazol reductase NimA-like FMN-containing flavoprotein (pyridoxamine 5'-phosphate oxidase superfamily)
MTVEPGSSPEDLLETLDTEACKRLLAATEFGRLAVVDSGRPKIIVLNHVIDGGHVLFRTREDSLLAGLTADDIGVPVAYEVDSAFPVGRSGWSVIAAGLLVRESDKRRVALARDTIVAWAEGDRDLVLRLDVEELTGRRAGEL